ncbi:hypothetical protein QZH41_017182 [Actinostola sp. cb2023]|nr:hypothetical protein QZH41_017182 [Actinostola sp. cb2023]
MQSSTSWLLPEQVSKRFFKEMCGIQKSLEQGTVGKTEVSKEAFIISLSHFLKQSKEDKAHIFSLVASDSESVSKQDIASLCGTLLHAYVIALKATSIGTQWKIDSTDADKERFVQMAIHELVKDHHADLSSSVSVSDLVAWFTVFPLIEHLFGAVLRACFIDLESIVESHSHGLAEGCEEIIGHVQYDRSHILVPCKLEVNFEETSTLLDIPSMLALNATLPATLRHRWRLLFSTKVHGDSSCFLFSLLPSLAMYHPTGYNENFIYLNHNMQTLPNGLGMGGQMEYFGFWLDASFGPGHSKGEPCTTYGNTRLSANENFHIDELEVWGVGVPPENQLQQRSVLDTEIEAKAFLEVIGKEFHSEGFREPAE